MAFPIRVVSNLRLVHRTCSLPHDLTARTFRLLGADGAFYLSTAPGTLGGNRRSKIYGRLECPSALAALRRGDSYRASRVFFADEASAVAAGYRPCARCLPERYAVWKRSKTRPAKPDYA